jgi:hypothetical protein
MYYSTGQQQMSSFAALKKQIMPAVFACSEADKSPLNLTALSKNGIILPAV